MTRAWKGWSTSRSTAFAAIVSLGITMTGTPARGQEAAPTLACDARATLSVPSGAKLVIHHPTAEQRRRLAAAKPWRFGPFDRTVFGFEWVLLFLDEPGPREDPRFQHVDLLVRLEGPRSPWLRLVGSDLLPSLPQLIVRQTRDPLRNVVRLATPDSTQPLFIVEATDEDTRSSVSLQYLIDFRPGRPRVPALLECVEMIAWGACGVPDANYGYAHGSIGCAWHADRGDFRCRETQGVDTFWGGRSAVREYPLLSPSETDKVREARVSSELAEMVAAGATGPSVRRDVDTLGPVHSVVNLGRPGGGTLVLLGAAGDSSSFGARFFLGVVAKDGSVRVGQVSEPALSPPFWIPDEFDGRPVVVPGTPQPGDLSFRASNLVSGGPGPSIVRVRVRESTSSFEEPQPTPEAVYWIGFQDRGTEVFANALRLATNTAEYTRCGGARTAPNAVGVRVLSEQPFAAELEVEPPHVVDSFAEGLAVPTAPGGGGSPPSECPVKVEVTWNGGFEVSEPQEPPPCRDARARLVRIDDDGEIRTVEAPTFRDDTPQ